jgi:hypothetical protein
MNLPKTEPSERQRLQYHRDIRKPWRRPVEQKPCDIGLFSDEANQLDLVEMLQQPLDE